MVAVLGLDGPDVVNVCRQARSVGIVEAANLNCPGQVVIAGELKALEQAAKLAREAGARRCLDLPVSAPFHSSMMQPAGLRLAEELAGVPVADPQIKVIANVSADYVNSALAIKTNLVAQVSSPVRWEELVRRLLADNLTTFVEVGPGKVLTGLIRKIDKNVVTCNVEDRGSLECVLALLGKDD